MHFNRGNAGAVLADQLQFASCSIQEKESTMTQKSRIQERGLLAIPGRDHVPARPADVIREADLEKIAGGGGMTGGVLRQQA